MTQAGDLSILRGANMSAGFSHRQAKPPAPPSFTAASTYVRQLIQQGGAVSAGVPMNFRKAMKHSKCAETTPIRSVILSGQNWGVLGYESSSIRNQVDPYCRLPRRR